MGKTFQKIHGCSVGKLEESSDKISQWIRNNGGSYSKVMNADVTHLITTKEAYKNNVEAVRKAKRLKTVKIVVYSWLSDSLLSKSRKPKCETPYLLETAIGGVNSKGTSANNASKKRRGRPGQAKSQDIFDSRCRASKTRKEASKYHPYTDPNTGESYSVTLVRPTQGKSREKYQLTIHEFSDTEPHVYATQVKYSRIGKSNFEMLASLGSTWECAFAEFQKFYLDQTGIEWSERSVGKYLPLKTDTEGNALPAHEGWFYHEAPTIISGFLRQYPADTVEENQQQQLDGDSMMENPKLSAKTKEDEYREEEEESDYEDAEEYPMPELQGPSLDNMSAEEKKNNDPKTADKTFVETNSERCPTQ